MTNINTTAIQPHAASDSGGSSSGALPGAGSLNNMFLQLLVAQLKNQSPLNPMDPTQFVGQLAQFSELSEVTSIYQLLQQQASPGKQVSAVHKNTASSALPGNVQVSSPASTAVSAAHLAAQAIPAFNSSAMRSFESKIQGVF